MKEESKEVKCEKCGEMKLRSKFYKNSPYICKICSKVKCNICGRYLSNKYNLEEHMKNIHNMEKSKKESRIKKRMLESEAQERAEAFFGTGKKRVFLGKTLQYEIDLYNEFIIGEVKHVRKFYEVPGQIFRYVIEEKDKSKRLVAYLFSEEKPKEEEIKKIRELFDKSFYHDEDSKRKIELYFDWEIKDGIKDGIKEVIKDEIKEGNKDGIKDGNKDGMKEVIKDKIKEIIKEVIKDGDKIKN